MEKNPWPLISGAVICWSNCEFMSTSASCLLCFYATFSATLSLPQKDSASPIWFVPVPFSLLLILLLFMVSFLCIARDIRGNVPICLLCFLVRYLPVCYLNLSISLLFYLCIYIFLWISFLLVRNLYEIENWVLEYLKKIFGFLNEACLALRKLRKSWTYFDCFFDLFENRSSRPNESEREQLIR